MSPPIVAHLVYDLIRGGTEGQCARVAMGLAKRGLPHRVAAFHRRGLFLESVESACGPVFEVGIRHALRLETWREIRRLAEWMRSGRTNILHAWDADAAIFGQFAARLAGARLATSRRDLGQIYPGWKTKMMGMADRTAVRVVANAEAIKVHFAGKGTAAGKIDVLPNALDMGEFEEQVRKPFAKAAQLPSGRRMAVVNRLDPEKNVGTLVEALPLVKKVCPDAALVVAGDGREMAALRNKAAELGMEDSVCFLGEVMDVPALLAKCAAGALVPSRNEGTSNTILEYMAAGLPTLATDCGGNRELVEEGATGKLLAPGSGPKEVAEAWIWLLEHPEAARAMGERGRKRVVERNSPGAVLDAFEAFYGRCMQEGGGRQ